MSKQTTLIARSGVTFALALPAIFDVKPDMEIVISDKGHVARLYNTTIQVPDYEKQPDDKGRQPTKSTAAWRIVVVTKKGGPARPLNNPNLRYHTDEAGMASRVLTNPLDVRFYIEAWSRALAPKTKVTTESSEIGEED